MKVLFINNDGGGFADYLEIQGETSIRDFVEDNVQGDPHDYLIRVNRQPVGSDYVLQENDRVTVTTSAVLGMTFHPGPEHASKFSLINILNDLRGAQYVLWQKLRDHWIVLEVYYPSLTRFQIVSDDREDPRTRISGAGGIHLLASGRIEWESANSFVVSDNLVPFAFSGFRVA